MKMLLLIILTIFMAVPFYAAVVYAPAAQGQAQVNSCTITKVAAGQQTYAQLVYTNIGETSKFFYQLTSSDYSTSGGSNSGSRIQQGSQKSENIAVSAITAGTQKIVKISISGESGITTEAICVGEVVNSNGLCWFLPVAVIGLIGTVFLSRKSP